MNVVLRKGDGMTGSGLGVRGLSYEQACHKSGTAQFVTLYPSLSLSCVPSTMFRHELLVSCGFFPGLLVHPVVASHETHNLNGSRSTMSGVRPLTDFIYAANVIVRRQ